IAAATRLSVVVGRAGEAVQRGGDAVVEAFEVLGCESWTQIEGRRALAELALRAVLQVTEQDALIQPGEADRHGCAGVLQIERDRYGERRAPARVGATLTDGL